jgi:hypothetical protein
MSSFFKWGNRKIGADTLIFNMSSATDCPSLKLGLCHISNNSIAKCYARKAENLYGQKIINYRNNQAVYWQSHSADEIFQYFAGPIASRKARSKDTNFFRYNEAGDFYSQSDIQKLTIIANRLKEEFGITTYGYTARSDLDYTNRGFLVKGSGWNNEQIDGTCIVINKIEPIPEGFIECPGLKQSCANCNLCKCNLKLNIAFRKH